MHRSPVPSWPDEPSNGALPITHNMDTASHVQLSHEDEMSFNYVADITPFCSNVW